MTAVGYQQPDLLPELDDRLVIRKPTFLSMIMNVHFGLRFQPVDATHWLNRSAAVSKFNVSLGLSLNGALDSPNGLYNLLGTLKNKAMTGLLKQC